MSEKTSTYHELMSLNKNIAQLRHRLEVYCAFSISSVRSIIQLSQINGEKCENIKDARASLVSNYWETNPIISFFQSYPEVLLEIKGNKALSNINRNVLPNIRISELERVIELKENILDGLRSHMGNDVKCKEYFKQLTKQKHLTVDDLNCDSQSSVLFQAFNYLSLNYGWIDIPLSFLKSQMTLKGFVGTTRILKTIKSRTDLREYWIFDWFCNGMGKQLTEKLNIITVMNDSLDKDDFFEPFYLEALTNGDYLLDSGVMIDIKPCGTVDYIDGTADMYFCYQDDGIKFKNTFVNRMQRYENDFIDRFYDDYIESDEDYNYLSMTYPRETFTMDAFANPDLGLLYESFSNQDRYFGQISYIICAPKLFLAKLSQTKIWNEIYWYPDDNAAVVTNDCLGYKEFDLLSNDLTSIVMTHDFFVKIDGECNGY